MRRQKLDASGICAAAIKEVRADGRSDCSAPGRLTKVPRARLRCCQLCVCRAGKRGRGCVPDVDHIIRHLISSHLTSETDRLSKETSTRGCLPCLHSSDRHRIRTKEKHTKGARHSRTDPRAGCHQETQHFSLSLALSVCLSVCPMWLGVRLD